MQRLQHFNVLTNDAISKHWPALEVNTDVLEKLKGNADKKAASERLRDGRDHALSQLPGFFTATFDNINRSDNVEAGSTAVESLQKRVKSDVFNVLRNKTISGGTTVDHWKPEYSQLIDDLEKGVESATASCNQVDRALKVMQTVTSRFKVEQSARAAKLKESENAWIFFQKNPKAIFNARSAYVSTLLADIESQIATQQESTEKSISAATSRVKSDYDSIIDPLKKHEFLEWVKNDTTIPGYTLPPAFSSLIGDLSKPQRLEVYKRLDFDNKGANQLMEQANQEIQDEFSKTKDHRKGLENSIATAKTNWADLKTELKKGVAKTETAEITSLIQPLEDFAVNYGAVNREDIYADYPLEHTPNDYQKFMALAAFYADAAAGRPLLATMPVNLKANFLGYIEQVEGEQITPESSDGYTSEFTTQASHIETEINDGITRLNEVRNVKKLSGVTTTLKNNITAFIDSDVVTNLLVVVDHNPNLTDSEKAKLKDWAEKVNTIKAVLKEVVSVWESDKQRFDEKAAEHKGFEDLKNSNSTAITVTPDIRTKSITKGGSVYTEDYVINESEVKAAQEQDKKRFDIFKQAEAYLDKNKKPTTANFATSAVNVEILDDIVLTIKKLKAEKGGTWATKPTSSIDRTFNYFEEESAKLENQTLNEKLKSQQDSLLTLALSQVPGSKFNFALQPLNHGKPASSKDVVDGTGIYDITSLILIEKTDKTGLFVKEDGSQVVFLQKSEKTGQVEALAFAAPADILTKGLPENYHPGSKASSSGMPISINRV